MVIKWTRLAVDSLKDIYDFYLPQTGGPKARQIVDDIRNETRYLLIFPELGACEQADDLPHSYRYIVKHRCKIYYTTHPGYVRIAFVWDTRRNPEQLKKFL